MSKVSAKFYSKNVFRCLCQMYAVKQIYDDSLRNFADFDDFTSESNDDFLFAELNKRYCKSCINIT